MTSPSSTTPWPQAVAARLIHHTASWFHLWDPDQGTVDAEEMLTEQMGVYVAVIDISSLHA